MDSKSKLWNWVEAQSRKDRAKQEQIHRDAMKIAAAAFTTPRKIAPPKIPWDLTESDIDLLGQMKVKVD